MSKLGIDATLHTLTEMQKELISISIQQERLMCRLLLATQKLESCRKVLEQLMIQNPEVMRVHSIEIGDT